MLKAKLLGATAAAEVVAIEEVFQSWLYTGNGSTQTITNGIDLAGEGGLVWVKSRSDGQSHELADTVRGNTKFLRTNSDGAERVSTSGDITSFGSSGFSLGASTTAGVNSSGNNYASWTFRKAPRFFDVVTYTGTGANRTLTHDLGVVPGCIIVKRTDTTADWQVYHRSNANTEYMVLNSTAAKATGATRWNSTTPTSTVFSLGTATTVNASGGTYVAYLFAHDPLGPSGDGSDGLIACGSYTGNSSDTGPVIDLGWEPQWIMIKRASAIEQWALFDNMRGLPTGGTDATLYADTSSSENSPANWLDITARGFQLRSANTFVNGSGDYIYIAIRRGPMREPTVGTEVFNVVTQTASAGTSANVGFPVDTSICTYRTAYNSNYMGVVQDRLRGYATANTSGTYPALVTNSTQTETALSPGNPVIYGVNNSQTSISFGTNAATGSTVVWNFRRAPGFFDVTTFKGNDSTVSPNIAHNLGVTPELIIVKDRVGNYGWPVFHSALGTTGSLYLSTTAATANNGNFPTLPTSTYFNTGRQSTNDANLSSGSYIAYLFASLPGISKVGSYTGNGSSQTINCGFTTGARFILIKRTDNTGDWYVWDTARGIVSGNDPHLSLNTTAAEVTSDDTIDPDNSGFIVNQVAATNVNVNAATYIYLAIA